MASLRKYRCKKCGYEIDAPERGYDTWFSGTYFYFKCKDCKNIYRRNIQEWNSISENMNFFDRITIYSKVKRCPLCESYENQFLWNPIEGHCPKCDSYPLDALDIFIDAD